MAPERKLAAIVFTDIAGFTKLSASDQDSALELITRQREVLRPIVESHQGRWVKEIGDGLLLIFDSSTQAVLCAIELQKAARDIPNLNLRIGIHSGEVVSDGGDVLGDDVNLASRIEPLSPVGGIAVSDRVNAVLGSKPGIQTRLIGRPRLKGIQQAIAVYAIVSHGLPAPDRNALSHAKLEPSRRKWLALGGAAAAGGAALWWGRRYALRTNAPIMQSIAVLPFVNLGGAPENEYFSDGVAEEIIDRLTHVVGLRVAARSSAFQWKGKNASARSIGQALGVRTVVEGSVQRQGAKLRIKANLVDVDTGYNIWVEHYERTSEDIFSIQDEIARAVVENVHIHPTAQEESRLRLTSTHNVGSYDAYVRGRQSFLRRTADGMTEASEHFQRAIDLDPNHALAHAFLANCYSLLSYYSRMPPRESSGRATRAAETALRLEPELPEGLIALGFPIYYYRWDFARADTLFSRAMRLHPNNPEGYHWYGLLHMAMHREQAGLDAFERARDLDPAPIFGTDVAWFQSLNGQHREAEKTIDGVLARDPGFSRGHHIRGEVMVGLGRIPAAAQAFEKASEYNRGINPYYFGLMGWAQGTLKHEKRAQEILAQLTAPDAPVATPALDIGLVHLGLGNHDAFFQQMDRALDERSRHFPFWVRKSPIFDAVRQDPRFAALLAKVRPI